MRVRRMFRSRGAVRACRARVAPARACAAPGEVAPEELPDKYEGGCQHYAGEKAKVEKIRNGHDATSGMAGPVAGLRV